MINFFLFPYFWAKWWTLLPFRVIELGWKHKKAAIVIILARIASVFFHNPSNDLGLHGIGPVRYILVGFANFFWGIIETVLHFGANVLLIPQKLWTAVHRTSISSDS